MKFSLVSFPFDIFATGRLTQEDWVIMQYDEALQSYKLVAGVVYFPMRWSLLDKFNKGMPGIHQPVQSFMKHLLTNVLSVMAKMSPDAPVRQVLLHVTIMAMEFS